MTRYLLDANVFIQAKNLHYGFDFCAAFWEWLVVQNVAGKVASIEKVAEELHAGKDDLSEWATKRGHVFFPRADDGVVLALTTVSAWATSQNYEPVAVAKFLQVADYWLVAHAVAHEFTIVTHEKLSDGKRRIKIPNACTGLGLHCATPYEMLRRERARFVLGAGGD